MGCSVAHASPCPARSAVGKERFVGPFSLTSSAHKLFRQLRGRSRWNGCRFAKDDARGFVKRRNERKLFEPLVHIVKIIAKFVRSAESLSQRKLSYFLACLPETATSQLVPNTKVLS